MKIASFILGAFIALFSVSAQAVTIMDGEPTNFIYDEDYYADMGDIHVGQWGNVDTQTFFGLYDYVARGLLAANSTITFTYTVSPTAGWDTLVNYWYTPKATSPDYLVTTGPVSSNVFSIIVSNFMDSPLAFSAGVQLPTLMGSVDTVYNVVANVPLPAALPLFGLGLVGLAGYRARKKAA